MNVLNIFRSIPLAVMLTVLTAGAQANSSDADSVASEGTVACAGNFAETSFTVDFLSRWTIRNLNDDASITVDRMRVFQADGTTLYDSDIHGPAPSATVVPFGVVGPYQALSIISRDLIDAGLVPGNLPSNQTPITAVFDWSSTSGKRVLTPYVLLTRRGASNSDTRHARDCRSID
jgi:hypothetical protein